MYVNFTVEDDKTTHLRVKSFFRVSRSFSLDDDRIGENSLENPDHIKLLEGQIQNGFKPESNVDNSDPDNRDIARIRAIGEFVLRASKLLCRQYFRK